MNTACTLTGVTDPQPHGPPLDHSQLHRAWALLTDQIRAGDPLDGFRRSLRLAEDLDELLDATRVLRDQQVVRVRDQRQLSLAALADLFSTEAGLEVGRGRMHQMVQNGIDRTGDPPLPDPAEKG